MLTTIKRYPEGTAGTLLSDFPPVLQRVYAQRGICNAEEVDYSLSRAISSEKLLNADTGASLIYRCMQRGQRILIVGDYDVDGATSTALFIRALHGFGHINVQYLVPNRFEFGYGLTPEIVSVAAEFDPVLIITVDNGISSIEGVAAAKAKGFDVLITDHHLPGDVLPQADAIINPNQPSDNFPSKNLAGVGVVLYTLSALRALLCKEGWFKEKGMQELNLAQFLDIVAVGTVADVVKLDCNNRILVDQGLRRIRAGKCCAGVRAILTTAGKSLYQTSSSDLGFTVGPRLNAAGRLKDMSVGIECLLTDDEERAAALARQLSELNEERKLIERQMQTQALDALQSIKLTGTQTCKCGIALYDSKWHQGVTGTVAARIKDRFHRPTTVFAKMNGNEIKGSARSITGLHIRDALDLIATRYPGLITTFGGHAMAAGLTMPLEKFEAFADIFDQTIKELVSPEQLEAILLSDGELNEHELSLDTAELLFRAGPWGQGFPEPMFDGVFNVNKYRIVGERHLKLSLTPVDGKQRIEAIAFNIDRQEWNESFDRVRIAYRLEVNEFRGVRSPQLNVQHLVSARA